MKILNIIANARRGGMPEHVLTLSRRLRERGHDVQVLSLSEGPMVAEFEKYAVGISTAPFLSHKMRRDPLLVRQAIRFTRRVIQENRPDVVHSHGPRAHIFTGLAARYEGRPPIVATVHGSHAQFIAGNEGEFGRLRRWQKTLQYRGVDRYTGHFADRIVAVCEATYHDLVDTVKVPALKVVVIRNGINEVTVSDKTAQAVRKEFGLSGAEKLVACVGRVAFHKGTQFLVEAMGAVGREVPGARLLIVGEGPMSNELKGKVADSGLDDKVIFTGERRDAESIIAASDLFVLPSLSEGLALTLLEAAMTSTAMVATDVGGNPEVVLDGKSGLLVKPRESKALAGAVIELLKDDERRKQMGTAARTLWENEFTAEKMADGVESLYSEIVDL